MACARLVARQSERFRFVKIKAIFNLIATSRSVDPDRHAGEGRHPGQQTPTLRPWIPDQRCAPSGVTSQVKRLLVSVLLAVQLPP
jgi:hypothetical protein